MRSGEVVPTAAYKSQAIHARDDVYMPSALSPHPKLRPLRAIAVKKMVRDLLNMGCKPCAIKGKNTTSGEPFNNFNISLYAGFIFYCNAQGLTKFHDMARSVIHWRTVTPPPPHHHTNVQVSLAVPVLWHFPDKVRLSRACHQVYSPDDATGHLQVRPTK